jgi:hypothetical protein
MVHWDLKRSFYYPFLRIPHCIIADLRRTDRRDAMSLAFRVSGMNAAEVILFPTCLM